MEAEVPTVKVGIEAEVPTVKAGIVAEEPTVKLWIVAEVVVKEDEVNELLEVIDWADKEPDKTALEAEIDVAEIDVGSGIFECGQTYVALSRVKSLDGLYLSSFDASRIRINKKVKVFYEELTTYQEANRTNEEVYVPLVIAEQIQNAIPLEGLNENPFIDYQFENAEVVKVIKLTTNT